MEPHTNLEVGQEVAGSIRPDCLPDLGHIVTGDSDLGFDSKSPLETAAELVSDGR